MVCREQSIRPVIEFRMLSRVRVAVGGEVYAGARARARGWAAYAGRSGIMGGRASAAALTIFPSAYV